MKGPEETYQVVNIPLSFAGFQEPLAFRSRGFPSLGEVLVELGEGAYSMLDPRDACMTSRPRQKGSFPTS